MSKFEPTIEASSFIDAEDAPKVRADLFPNPYSPLHSENISDVFKARIIDFPEQALCFGLQAIESEENFGVGMQYVSRVVQEKGWDYFFSLVRKADSMSVPLLRNPSRLHEIVIECIHQLSSPRDLATEKIEEFLEETRNDLEWIKLSSYISMRKQVENIEGFSPELCRDILREKDIPFWNIEKSKEVAGEILQENHEAYVGLLEELKFYYRENFLFRNREEEKKQMNRWKQMDKRELLEGVHPVYAFNVVTKCYPDDADEFTPEALSSSKKGEVIQSIILPDNDLRDLVSSLVQRDSDSFQRIFFEKEIGSKGKNLILSSFRGRDLISPLEGHISREGKSEVDSWGYIANSTVVDVAQRCSMIFSPSGKFLEMVESSSAEAENKGNDHKLAISLRMAHILSDKEVSLRENSAAIMLLFWRDFPEDVRQELEEYYSNFGVDVGSFVESCPDSFELALSFSQDIEQLLPEQFTEWLVEYAATQYEESREKLLPVQIVDTEKIIRDIVAQVGEIDSKKGNAVEDSLNLLTFASLQFLSRKLDMDVSRISVAEFFSLLVFLRGNCSGNGYRKLEKLLDGIENETDRSHRVKAFLSFYQGGADMGEKILAIGEKLPKEAADTVFGKYAEMADSSREEAKKMYVVYKKTFSPDSITEEKIAGALLANANTLIRDMGEALKKEMSLESGKELADSLVESLEKNHIARERILEEFLAVSESLATLVADLEKEYVSLPGAFSSPENQEGFIQETPKEGEKFLTEEFGPEALRELKRKNQEMKEWERLHQDEVIWDIIQEIEREYANTQEMLVGLQRHDIAQKTAEKLRKSVEENAKKYQPITRKLTEVLKQRGRMKKKFDEMLYGRESATLPRGFFDGVSETMRNIHAEIPETSKPVYFPVGISKELSKWENVLAGKGKSAKPIDLYNFLFWLNAQGKESGKPIFLPVADETQAWNFEALYGKTREEALEVARAIGKTEGERYQTIVQTFGLEYVRVVSYKEFFLDTEAKTKTFERYRAFLTRISTTPNWAGAFENMVGDSVSGKQAESSTTKEEKEKLFPYAIEELALLLTTRGMKVSHPNEARYDVVAAALENLERYAKEKNIDFFDPDQYDRLRPALRSILKALGDRLNNLSKETQSVCGRAYVKSAQMALKRIQFEKGESVFTKREEKALTLDFFPASPDSRSFGWRSAGSKGEEERLTFKEPYSTYFPASESAVFLEDQVVAMPEGIIAGKILTLSAEKQNEYAEAVLKPLLAHYFASLKSAPQSYFHSVGKTENALVEICQKSETLGDLLAFIQRYIVAPSVRGANKVSPNEER